MMQDQRTPFLPLAGRSVPDCFARLHTPCYVLDAAKLRKNGEILAGVQQQTGARILLAEKAFSNYKMFPLLSKYLAGTEASGLYEARLGREEMPQGEVHVFCGAYREEDIPEILKYADHIIFNSPGQLSRFGRQAKEAGRQIGLRINPECSTQEGHAIYDPCSPGSRLGVTRERFDREMTSEMIDLLDGLHFHTLCEQNSDDLAKTLDAVEERFGDILPKLSWINFGGGHHITREDYDIPLLEKCIRRISDRYGLQVYLEPGEACALNAGYLVSTVLDVFWSGETSHAILDVSAACHMPDVLEMPYRAPLYAGFEPGEKQYTVRLGGPTCLAGDLIGDYSFDQPLQIGDRLVFGDMAIYTTCKNNTFNGMPLPFIYCMNEDGSFELLNSFGYEDFKSRL